jgi:hypothetical protein
MTSRLARIAAVAAAALLSVGTVAYLGTDDPPQQVMEGWLLLDLSESVGTDVCAEAEEVARSLVRASTGKVVLKVHRLSGRSRDGQPIHLADVPLSPAGSPLHGADDRAADERRFVAAVGRACREAGRTKESPIVAAVAALFAQINGLGFQPGLSRVVILLSDGVEEEDVELSRVLRGARPAQQPRIENRGVATILCGTAYRAPHRRWMPSPEAVAAGWPLQFKAAVSVLPTCRGLEPLLRVHYVT